MRRSIRTQYRNKYTDEDLRKIDIKISLKLGLERGEAARRTAILDAVGIATMDELRAEAGLLGTLSKEQRDRLNVLKATRRGRGIAERTIEDILSDYMKRKEEPAPVTPESGRQQKTA